VRFEDVAICLADQPGAAIFITDPESQHKPDWQILGSLFGLTTAEARLTILLLQGHTLKEAADQIKVTINTVHSQLKSVFAKTGVNRQADLMRILLTGPAQLHFRSHSADSLPRTSGLNT
jgi:DNA-binding CsgD family transcriptional regulator